MRREELLTRSVTKKIFLSVSSMGTQFLGGWRDLNVCLSSISMYIDGIKKQMHLLLNLKKMPDIEFETVSFFYDDVYLPWFETNIKTGI